MSGLTLFGFTLFKSQTEREIQNLFQHYEKTLSDQKLKMYDDITEWGDALTRIIDIQVKKQKYLLEQKYTNQISYLNQTCQRFVEELRVHEQLNKTEQMNQLLNKCQALKFELDALEYNVKRIRFIEVPTKQRMKMNQDEFDIIETENNKLIINSTVKNNNEAEDNMDTHLKLYPSLSSTSAKQTDGLLSRTNSADVSNRLTTSDNYQKSFDVRDDNLIEKCPICFMIFPSTMKAPDRSQHIYEHNTDD